MDVNGLFEVLSEGGLKKAYHYQPEKYLFDGLNIDTKKFYQNKKEFLKLMTEYDVANHCMKEVNSRVKCYR